MKSRNLVTLMIIHLTPNRRTRRTRRNVTTKSSMKSRVEENIIKIIMIISFPDKMITDLRTESENRKKLEIQILITNRITSTGSIRKMIGIITVIEIMKIEIETNKEEDTVETIIDIKGTIKVIEMIIKIKEAIFRIITKMMKEDLPINMIQENIMIKIKENTIRAMTKKRKKVMIISTHQEIIKLKNKNVIEEKEEDSQSEGVEIKSDNDGYIYSLIQRRKFFKKKI